MASPRRQRAESLVMVSAALLLCLHNADAFLAPRQRIDRVGSSPSRRGDLDSNVRKADDAHSIACRWRLEADRGRRSLPPTALRATENKSSSRNSSSDSWSKASTKGRTESRLRVRSRVKSVLAKARNRTGVKNNSEERQYSLTDPQLQQRSRRIKTEMTAADVVADAASIGGLGAVVVDDKGTVDVALDYVAPPKSERKDTMKTSSKQGTAAKPITDTVASSPSSEGTAADVAAGSDMNGKAKTTKNLGEVVSASKKKTSPASTYSDPPTPPLQPNPEDSLVPASAETTKRKDAAAKKDGMTEVDAFKGDVSAAFSMPPPPLPFTLPDLTSEQQRQLDNGERVQFQNDMGREGSGFVVLDVKAPDSAVWDCLLDFHSYPETIPTVRDVTMYTNTHLTDDYRHERPVAFEDGTMATLRHGIPSVTRAAFTLSKFRLKIAAIHKYRPHPLGDYMVFTLDPACTNMVLKAAKGVWHTQTNPDGKGEEYTRVWLLCELKVSRLLPKWIVDYAARRAMPRATTWIKPQVETANALWLSKDREDRGASS